MEFFIPNIPATANPKQIKSALREVFQRYLIYAFEVQTWTNKRESHKQNTKVLIHDENVGEVILRAYGPLKSPHRIFIAGTRIHLLRSKSNAPIAPHAVKALRDENTRKARALAIRQPPEHKPYRTPIPFESFECGVWVTVPTNSTLPTFSSLYRHLSPGNLRMTKEAIQVHTVDTNQYILCNNSIIRTAIVTHEANNSYFVVSMRYCPRFYTRVVTSSISPAGYQKSKITKSRVPFLDGSHQMVAPYCYVYRFKLRKAQDANRLSIIGALPNFLEVGDASVFYERALYDFDRSMRGLEDKLLDLPFPVAFQLQTLAYNGLLLPHRVKEILGVVNQALPRRQDDFEEWQKQVNILAATLKYWVDRRQPQHHSDDPKTWLQGELITNLRDTIDALYNSKEIALQMKFHTMSNQNLIHRVVISPSSIYLQGPSPEPKNRVLRLFEHNINNFVRVVLMDEGGRDLQFERGTEWKQLFSDRFRLFLMPESPLLRIAGRTFTFLGFSQSSLRSHAAWFMSPFYQSVKGIRRLWTVDEIIKYLGDFGNIRIPGKCAARIGQAFTDTIANITIDVRSWAYARDIESRVSGRTYTFSDGCGTINEELWHKIKRKLGKDHGKQYLERFDPTVFQIRLAGAKGVVSLDTTLPREINIKLRNSMVKFDSPNHRTFEICLSVTKPSSLYMNRHLVKILEDRGVKAETFLALQNEVLLELKQTTRSADKTAYWLERQGRCRPSDTSFLIRELARLGFNYKEDHFLRQVVEYSMLSTLRDLKYRARIPIKKGYTLMGIMDETGYLEEGEIYCPIKEEEYDRWAIIRTVAIARSPALHPGDIQIVRAVDVPTSSRLQNLTNCVVFSQKGGRDLPNMLAGGDLDGDQFHIWWEERMIPRYNTAPADYDTIPAVAMDRPVTQADIGDFFLDFMENDRLGQISIAHMIHADQQDDGVFSQECLQCAKLASTAVDFPKSGVPVRINDLPRAQQPNMRPDFLAPGPRVKVANSRLHLQTVTQEDSEDEDEDPKRNLFVQDDPFAVSKSFLYYQSDKALGRLFREIDEFKFVQTWEAEARQYERNGPHHLIKKVCQDLLKRVTNLSSVMRWNEYARDLRISYEHNVHELALSYTARRDEPLQEVEVFIGCILGTESHRQTRFQRDASETLRQDMNKLVAHTMARIRHGSEDHVVEEGKYDGYTLERAVMCVMESYTARDDGLEGRSFGWLAAAVALREIEKQGQQQRRDAVVESLVESMGTLRFSSLR